MNKEQIQESFIAFASLATNYLPKLALGLGIYERLLSAINAINFKLISVFKNEGLKGVWSQIDGNFLLKILFGMAIGFIVGLKIIVDLLESHPIHIWSFFFGLIIASIPLITKQLVLKN